MLGLISKHSFQFYAMWFVFEFLFLSFFYLLLGVEADVQTAVVAAEADRQSPQVFSRSYRYFANPHNRKFELFDEHFYLANYGESVISQNVSAYDHWVNKGLYEGKRSHGGLAVMAFIVMTKDDWPLIKHWVFYHGDKFGFKNLYVFDGSNDPRCIHFLHTMRDKKGLTLIETKTSLTYIAGDMTHLATQELVFRYDYIIKMDTDEFLVHYDHSKEKITFDNILDNLSTAIYDGIIQKVNFLSFTIPDKGSCEDPLVREHGPVFVAPFHSMFLLTVFKAVFPTASMVSIDLGGHSGSIHPDFNTADHRFPGESCPPSGPYCFRHVPGLSVLHSHYGCVRTELRNLRKAIISHGYISQNDTVEQQIAKLATKSTGCTVASCHKVRAYYAYITNPSGWEGSYYKNLTRQFGALTKSLELRDVMVSLEAKYSDV